MATNSRIKLIIKSFLLVFVVAALNSSFAQGQISVLPFDRDEIKVKDYVSLKSGQKLFGEITEQGNNGKSDFLIIRTQDGTTLKLNKRFYSKAHPISREDEIYNNKLDVMSDDPEGHWSCVEWLEKQEGGRYRYKDQIEFHLERIMALDPNDTKAKNDLGYEYIEHQNRWVPEELYFKSIGYVPKGSGWAPELQASINDNADELKKLQGERKRRFAKWKNVLRSGRESDAALAKELFSLCDEMAIPFIFKEVQYEKNPKLRGLYIEAFGRVPCSAATQALVFYSVEDPTYSDRALDLLGQPQFNQEFAASHLSRYFDPSKYDRDTIQRAAFNIGELKAEGAFLPLVGVLHTKHVVKAAESRTQAGSVNGEIQSFSTGSTPAQSVTFSNESVAEALGKISNQSFGFDEGAWRKWYIQNNTIMEIDIRGDN